MAQEITVNLSLAATKGSLVIPGQSKTMQIDMAGSRYDAGVQDIGTSVEQVVIKSDMASAGWALFTNLDATNFVQIGPNNGSPYMLRLKAGESAPVRLDNLTLYAKADTATIKLGYLILEA